MIEPYSTNKIDEKVEEAVAAIATGLAATWVTSNKHYPSVQHLVSNLKRDVTDEEHWHLIIQKVKDNHPDLAQEIAEEIFSSHYFERSPFHIWSVNLCFLVFLDGSFHFFSDQSLIYSFGLALVSYEWEIWWVDFLITYLAIGLHTVAFCVGLLAPFHYLGWVISRIKGHYEQPVFNSGTKNERNEPKL